MTELEREFEEWDRRRIEECRALDPPYIPTVWIGMKAKYGSAVEAARVLYQQDETFRVDGGERLIRDYGRPNLTLEHGILMPEHHDLFSDRMRQKALDGLESALWLARHGM